MFELATLKVLYKASEYPVAQTATVKDGYAYLVTEQITGRFQLEDGMADGVYHLKTAEASSGVKPVHPMGFAQAQEKETKLQSGSVVEVDVQVLHNALKRMKAFSKDGTVLFMVHQGKFSLGYRDSDSKAEIVVGKSDSGDYFQFIDVGQWYKLINCVLPYTDHLNVKLYNERFPLAKIEDELFCVFVIGRKTDNTYF